MNLKSNDASLQHCPKAFSAERRRLGDRRFEGTTVDQRSWARLPRPARHVLTRLRSATEGAHSRVRERERALPAGPEPILTVNTAEAAVLSAIDGQGVTCLLSYQVDSALSAGDLLPLLTSFEPDPVPVHLVYPAGSTSSAKVRAFVELATPRLRAILGDSLRSAQRRRK